MDWTEEETAAAIGYSRSWVQKVKRGDVVPKRKPWSRLEAAEREAGIGSAAPSRQEREGVADESGEYIITEPLRTARALAQCEHGDSPAGQSAFERHLANLRAFRETAEGHHPDNPAAAAEEWDRLIASYLSGMPESDRADPVKAATEEGLRRGFKKSAGLLRSQSDHAAKDRKRA